MSVFTDFRLINYASLVRAKTAAVKWRKEVKGLTKKKVMIKIERGRERGTKRRRRRGART